MRTGPETRVYVSVSARPGRFGATVYGALFERYGIDAVYLPRPAPSEARAVTDSVRALSIAGCSVSSPHKRAVIESLDVVDAGADAAQSVNTIVRTEDGRLAGYSTDVDGVVGALGGVSVRTAVVYGAGGVLGAAVVALRRLGAERIVVCARSLARAREEAARFGVEHADAEEAASGSHDVLVNATPVGRTAEGCEEVERLLAGARVLLDMPVSARATHLSERARAMGIDVRDGVAMCVHQVCAQARLYLGREVPVEIVREIVEGTYLRGA